MCRMIKLNFLFHSVLKMESRIESSLKPMSLVLFVTKLSLLNPLVNLIPEISIAGNLAVMESWIWNLLINLWATNWVLFLLQFLCFRRYGNGKCLTKLEPSYGSLSVIGYWLMRRGLLGAWRIALVLDVILFLRVSCIFRGIMKKLIISGLKLSPQILGVKSLA